MKLCPTCHRKMPLKKLTPSQLEILKEFHHYISCVHVNNKVQYASSILMEFKSMYPSFKGSQKLIIKHLCQLGCRLDSMKIGNKTVGIIIIK